MRLKDELNLYMRFQAAKYQLDEDIQDSTSTRAIRGARPKMTKGVRYSFKEVEPAVNAELSAALATVRIVYKHIDRALKEGNIAKLDEAERKESEDLDRIKSGISRLNERIKRTYGL